MTTTSNRRGLSNSEQKKLKSVYMGNQLDLNETEMEDFENTIEGLLEKLEQVHGEKAELEERSLFLLSKLEECTGQLDRLKEVSYF
jgi:peptidoglycan hydrolase CwlO-like protein